MRERNLDYGLFALAFVLALLLRLLRLGEISLGDNEARWALQSLDLVKGLKPVIGIQPLYVLLTGAAFFIAQSSNFAARLVPALFGALLPWVPYQFRDRLGKKPALLLAFMLALDPGFLAISKLAGSPVISAATFLFAWSAWRKGSFRAAGVWIGLALLSGPYLWMGVLILLVSLGLIKGTGINHTSVDDETVVPAPQMNRVSWFNLGFYTLGTYVIVGSLFFLVSGGLSAGFGSIPAYFGGLLDLSDVPVTRLLIALGTYELLAVILGIMSLVRGILQHDELVIKLGLWLLAALVIVLAYPTRQVSDLVWVLIPLLSLAALELSHHINPIQDGVWETIGMTIFTASILVFTSLNYSAIALVQMDPADLQLRWYIMFGAFGLLVVSIAMVAFGWSTSTAIQGGIWGSLLVLVFCSLSMSMAAAGLRTDRTFELWTTGTYAGQEQTLLSQLNDLSRWKKGVNSTLDVTVAAIDSPALLWSLRNWSVTVLDDPNIVNSSPSVVISNDQFSSTDIESIYRGQDLSWRVTPQWNLGLLPDWLHWSITHQFPKKEEKIILWVRSDIFIDSQNGQ